MFLHKKDIQRRYKFCNKSADVGGDGISVVVVIDVVVVVVVVVIGRNDVRTEGCVDKLMAG